MLIRIDLSDRTKCHIEQEDVCCPLFKTDDFEYGEPIYTPRCTLGHDIQGCQEGNFDYRRPDSCIDSERQLLSEIGVTNSERTE